MRYEQVKQSMWFLAHHEHSINHSYYFSGRFQMSNSHVRSEQVIQKRWIIYLQRSTWCPVFSLWPLSLHLSQKESYQSLSRTQCGFQVLFFFHLATFWIAITIYLVETHKSSPVCQALRKLPDTEVSNNKMFEPVQWQKTGCLPASSSTTAYILIQHFKNFELIFKNQGFHIEVYQINSSSWVYQTAW